MLPSVKCPHGCGVLERGLNAYSSLDGRAMNFANSLRAPPQVVTFALTRSRSPWECDSTAC
jgi:hypothetical protein